MVLVFGLFDVGEGMSIPNSWLLYQFQDQKNVPSFTVPLVKEEHVLVSAVFAKSQISQGCCTVFWQKRRVSSMWKFSLLERRF